MTPPAPNMVKYKSISGSGVRRSSGLIAADRAWCRLWLGDDHLLQTELRGNFFEQYKRFYFRDIQAITVQRTRVWQTGNIVWGTLLGLFLFWTLAVRKTDWVYPLAVFTGIFALFFAANLFMGPTCRCRLQTAVNQEDLPSLRRWRKARPALALIRSSIESAQPAMAPEAMGLDYEALLARLKVAAAAPGKVSRWNDPVLAVYRGKTHFWLFVLLLACAAHRVLGIVLPGGFAYTLGYLLHAAAVILVILALIRQSDTDLRQSLRALTWAAALWLGINTLVGYIMLITMSASSAPQSSALLLWNSPLARLEPLHNPWLLGYLIVSGVLAAGMGVFGLLLLRAGKPPAQSPP